MSPSKKTRVRNRVILPLVLDLLLWPAALLAQNQPADSRARLNSTSTQSRVTFTQRPPTASESARPPRDSFCGEADGDYYSNNYADGVQPSESSEQGWGLSQSRSGVDEIPDERIQSLPRVEEIPDERVQEIPDERIGPAVPTVSWFPPPDEVRMRAGNIDCRFSIRIKSTRKSLRVSSQTMRR